MKGVDQILIKRRAVAIARAKADPVFLKIKDANALILMEW